MSDDDKNSATHANSGVTLPNGNGATHDAGFSPLFVTRTGHAEFEHRDISNRGVNGILWSTTEKDRGMLTYFSHFAHEDVNPSTSTYSVNALSLRCLVSTNNG